MNTYETLDLVNDLNVAPLIADKTRSQPEIDALLDSLGNVDGAIPFVAIYPADGSLPMTFSGLITQGKITEALQQAGHSHAAEEDPSLALSDPSEPTDPPSGSSDETLAEGENDEPGSSDPSAEAPESGHLPWQPYSAKLLEQLLAEGTTVLVDFTSDT